MGKWSWRKARSIGRRRKRQLLELAITERSPMSIKIPNKLSVFLSGCHSGIGHCGSSRRSDPMLPGAEGFLKEERTLYFVDKERDKSSFLTRSPNLPHRR